jgi:lycopene cyclase CruA
MSTYALPLDSQNLTPEALREHLRIRYPRTVAQFATLPNGDAELRRLYELNTTWRHLSASRRPVTDVVVELTSQPSPPLPSQEGESGALHLQATFDIIYAGGGLNLLNAAVMTLRYGMRVLVMDRFTVGAVHREWNISRRELQELLHIGLLTPLELESIIQREYTDGIVRFYPDHIQVPPAELHLRGVLNVAVDADKLTTLCIQKILAANPANCILHQTTFRRCYVYHTSASTAPTSPPGPHTPAEQKRRWPGIYRTRWLPKRHNRESTTGGVIVEVTDIAGKTAYYGARLLVDGMGATSPVACQLNCGRPFSLVCPTVGTVARGYRQGGDPLAVDPQRGEILVTTADACDGRQLIWETFPGKDDQVAIYLFHYVNLDEPHRTSSPGGKEADTRVDLLELFEQFFTLLPTYKDITNVTIIKPVYGLIPSGYKNPSLRQADRKVLAFDHVISLGDAAALQSPLTFCGFGSAVRNLRRITTLLALALRDNRLRAADLAHIRAYEAVPALARAFSKFMIANPYNRPEQVNETLNVFCRALNDLGEQVAAAFFRDRIAWADYTRLLLRTVRIYPHIFPLTFRTLTLSDGIAWIRAYLAFSRAALQATLYRCTLRPLLRTIPAYLAIGLLHQAAPRVAFRLAAFIHAQEQTLRQ